MRAAAWMLFGRWAFYVVTLVSFSLIVRFISVDSYGIYVLAGTFLIFSDVFFNDAVENAIVRQQGSADLVGQSAFWVVLKFSFFVCLVTILSSYPMALVYKIDQLVPLLLGIALVVLVQGCASVPRALLLKSGAARKYALYSGGCNLIGAVFGIVAAANGFEFWSFVIQQGVLQFCMLVLCSWSARFVPRLDFDKAVAREMSRFIRTSFASCVLNVVTNRLDVIFIGLYFGPGEVGVYGLAKRLIQIIQELVGSSFDKALVSFKSKAGNLIASNAYRQSVVAQCLLLFPAFGGFAATADLLIPLLFGNQWGEAPMIVVLLGVGGVFRSMVTIERAELVVEGRAGTILHVRFIELLIGLLAVVPFAQYGGAWMAVGFSVRYIIGYFLVMRSRFDSWERFVAQVAENISWVKYSVVAVSFMLSILYFARSFLASTVHNPFLEFLLFLLLGAFSYFGLIFVFRSKLLLLIRGKS
jgi:O-antigen/teichoic acid export membrane protein